MRAVGRRLFWSCHACGHQVSAMSEHAIQAAMDDHAEYVNRTVDRTVDAHFEDIRIDQAIAP